MKKIYIFGHKNPDTDSVTSAIALSYLKNKLGMNTEPRILGEINKETAFVLNYFKVPVPVMLDDVKVQIEDIPFKRNIMINENASIYEAYTEMVNGNYTGIPIINDKKTFLGYVSLKEIAADFIKGDFNKLNASYSNILKVLNAKKILQFDDDIKGDIYIDTYKSEKLLSKSSIGESSIVIAGHEKKIIDSCIKKHVKLIIIVDNQTVSRNVLAKAKSNKINIIKTSKSVFEVTKILGFSNNIKTILRNETPVTFTKDSYLTDFYEISNKLKHTNYPIVDKKNKCHGMLRLLDVNKYEKKKVILVDHNDIKQSVAGLNEATIMEIIDHHALGSLTTSNPISFRNMIVGSTNTIIYHLFDEAGVKIPKCIAGLMLSGILSDTLVLKSPTTTDIDIEVTKKLAKIAKMNYELFGMKILKAGSSLEGLSIEEIVFRDYKEFQVKNMSFGIGQVLTQDFEQVLNKKSEYVEYLNKTCEIKGLKFIALFIIDIVRNGSYVIYSDDASQIISYAFGIKSIEEALFLPGIISRKKQIIPSIVSEFENID